MTKVENPRTIAKLETLMYRQAGALGAAAQNTYNPAEEAHLILGRKLCIEMFGRLVDRRHRNR